MQRLNAAVAAALADGVTNRRLAGAYIDATPMTAAEMGTAMEREHARLGGLIRQLGIKVDGGA